MSDQDQTPVTLENAEYSPPSDEYLREQVLNHLRNSLPRSEYRELRESGELENSIAFRLQATKRYAQSLIETGTFPSQAWNWAIRVKILEAEMD